MTKQSKYFFLVYLFLIIAIGLGCGANQLVITAVGIIFALILIIIYSGYMKNSRKSIEDNINLGVIIDQDSPEILIKKHGRKNLEEVFLKLTREKDESK